MDEFKKYLRQNKEKMDFDIPSPTVWENIRKSKKITPFLWVKYAVAAAVLAAVFLLGFLFNNKLNQNDLLALKEPKHSVIAPLVDSPALAVNKSNKLQITGPVETTHKIIAPQHLVTKAEKSKNAVSPVDKESSVAESFGEMQKSFGIIINYQLNKIKSTPLYGEDDNYFSLFKKDFQDLTTDEQAVKTEITHSGLSDVAIQKLITVYQQKILLLKRLQGEITKVNAHTPKSENIQQQKPTYLNL